MHDRQLGLWTPEAPPRSGAVISRCGRYRYSLWRFWDEIDMLSKDAVNFIMLNPSTADAAEDDHTIRRCIVFAKDWGYCGIVVTNLFPFRATSPKDLRNDTKFGEVGDAANGHIPVNDLSLRRNMLSSGLVVCAWGNHGAGGHAKRIVAMVRESGKTPYCLGRTKSGEPVHPLYLPSIAMPIPMETYP